MNIVADMHTHSVASGHGYSTIDEIVTEAAAKGLKAVGITDHGPAIPGGAHLYHFWNLRVLPRKMNGVYVLKGAEANIISPDGDIDLDEDALEVLDIVHVSFHPRCGYESKGAAKNTEALIGAMKNPYVDVVAHPGNPNYPIDFDKIVGAAKKYGVFLELNNTSFAPKSPREGSYKNDLEIAKKAHEAGLDAIIGSDAHFFQQVGNFKEAKKVAKEAGYTEERIFNSSLKRLSDFLENKGKEPLQ